MTLLRNTLWVGMLVAAHLLHGQTTQNIPLQPSAWTAEPGSELTFETFDGRPTLLLNGKAFANEIDFSNGVLELEVYANQKRSFAGFLFRKKERNFEEIYMRMHKSRQVDAVQYTPTYHGESNWQLYPEHQAQVAFLAEGWNQLRVEVQDLSATVFVNGAQVLQVDHLKSGNLSGGVGIWALFGNRFANIKVTPTGEAVAKEPYPIQTPPVGMITEWELTEAKLYKEGSINPAQFAQMPTQRVRTETSGLLPISKYVPKPSSGNFEGNPEVYSVASTTISTNQALTQWFSFDYSDKIILYLNGAPIFYGNNAFRSKNNQFQGHLGLGANKILLHLKKGSNTLHCVVIDKANGWGLIGKLE
ncbi:family 16 glycoside hydrolase [Flagellimonas marinaquae]|uniref:family 16 glycoside hydrolase n=1 Tax=Flagellimonas marinaquae TaxID=254955 RepID=UPI000F8F72F1|nr:family 16 glycoside hydrolase [Allomuricauda aquimarina]